MNAIRDQFPIFAAQPAPFHYPTRGHRADLPGGRRGTLALRDHHAGQRQAGRLSVADEATNAFHAPGPRSRPISAPRMPTRSCSPPDVRWHQHGGPRPVGAPAPRRRDPGSPSSSITAISFHGRWRPSVPARASEPSRSRPKAGSPTTGWMSSCPRAPGSSPSAMPPTSPVRWPMSPSCAMPPRAVGAVLLLDGAQRAPHGPLDVGTLGCDLYAFSAHKMFGPTGAGRSGAGRSCWPSCRRSWVVAR